MKKIFIAVLVILVSAIFLFNLAGCSGSAFNGGAAQANSGHGSSGAVAFKFSQNAGKYIPSSTSSFYISITGEGLSSATTQTVAYSTSTVTFDGLPLGSKIAEITALDALGVTLSKGRVSFVIEAGKTTSASVSLGLVFTDSAFSPSAITISPGTTLYFYNGGNNSHNLTGSSIFNGTSIASGSSWSVTFSSTGTYTCYLDSTDSGISATIAVSSAPSAPSNLTATAVASSGVNLTWTDTSTNETGFKIERKTGAGGVYAEVATVAAGVTSYGDTILAASTTYYYRVRAYNSFGDSDYSIAANASTSARYVYVTNNVSNNISVINTATNTVTATIGSLNSTIGIVVSPDGNFIYATKDNNKVVKISTATNTVVATVATGNDSRTLAVTPDGNFVYVPNYSSDNVTVINTSTFTVVATVSAGTNPFGIAITPNGNFAYVTNEGSSNTSVINIATNTVVATVATANTSRGVAVTPSGSFAYAASWGFNLVTPIDTSTYVPGASIAIAGNPYAITIAPDGSFAYVTRSGANKVSVINMAANAVTAEISVGTDPRFIAVTPDSAYVYLANYTDNTVSVINTATNTVTATIALGPAGTGPWGIAITP